MATETRPWLRMEGGLPTLETERMTLRIARLGEEGKIVRYLNRNREHLQPWEPMRDDFYFTMAAWLGAPERDQKEAREGSAYRFRMLPRTDGTHANAMRSTTTDRIYDYIGTVSLRDIFPWPGQSATIGYSLDHEYEGRGLMREAVAAVVRFGFEHLNLRRIEACYMPSNVRSERLLQSLGFQVEGLLRSSLEVNGKWEDHRICSLINQEWRRD